ncbi:hypothetical protein [Kineosporia sp. A_224]|uniref:hypothetical protein n=1 Tax=Kineosporia sp. A_224 TaxID=1962180 RepID=UPI000B4AF8D8|nr:hypothetical protein [Kineosporia sp. A_224]
MTGRGRTWHARVVRGTVLVLGAGLLVTGLTGCGLRDRDRARDDAGTTTSAATPSAATTPAAAKPATKPATKPAGDPATKPAGDPAPDVASSAEVAAVEALVGDAADAVGRGEAAVASDD